MCERLRAAWNAHDPTRVAALFAEDYRSHQPAHPSRDFAGRAQVLQNWTSVFVGVPDFRAELLASSVTGATEWGEWRWRGTHLDGSPFAMSGVTVLVLQGDLIAEARLYLEPVDADDAGQPDIDEAVQDLYRPQRD